jgi:Bacterial Ig-like domain (group 2)
LAAKPFCKTFNHELQILGEPMRNFLIMLLLVLVSCGGNTPEPTPETFTIQITPGAALLTKTGETKALTAKVLNSSGNAVDKTVTWTSSNPETVQISSDGVITALKDLGSSQITASLGEDKSLPLVVMVAQPTPGAVLVPDAQILTEPKAVTANPSNEIGALFTLTLSAPAPAVGSALISSEGKAVAGKVVAVTETNGVFDVTIETVPVTALFKSVQFQYNQTITPAQVDALPDLTPKSELQSKGNFDLLGFKCDTGNDILQPFIPKLEIAPKVEINPDLFFKYDNGLQHLGFSLNVKGSMKITGSARFGLNFKGEVKCKRLLKKILLPIGGWLSFLIFPVVPISLGVEVSGDVGVSAAEIGVEMEGAIEAKAGFNYTPATKTGFADGKISGKFSPIAILPNNAPYRAAIKMSANLVADFGLGFITNVEYDILTAKGGPVASAKFFNVEPQIIVPTDPARYDLTLDVTAGLHKNFIVGIEKLDNVLSGTTIGLLQIFDQAVKQGKLKVEFVTSFPLLRSPKAFSDKLIANTSLFKTGEVVNFKVEMDPADISIGIYNIKEIRVYRRINLQGDAELIASQTATEGQKSFNFDLTAKEGGLVKDNFYAFVVPRILGRFPFTDQNLYYALGKFVSKELKIQPGTLVDLALNNTLQFTAKLNSVLVDNNQLVWTTTGGTISSTGLYKGTQEGTFAVKVALKDSPETVAEGSVKVTKGPAIAPSISVSTSGDGDYRLGLVFDLATGQFIQNYFIDCIRKPTADASESWKRKKYFVSAPGATSIAIGGIGVKSSDGSVRLTSNQRGQITIAATFDNGVVLNAAVYISYFYADFLTGETACG